MRWCVQNQTGAQANSFKKKLIEGARETTQLQALDALPEDLGLVPSTQRASATACNSISRGSNALFWLPWALHAYGTHSYMQALNT